jgi:hypothetical protein
VWSRDERKRCRGGGAADYCRCRSYTSKGRSRPTARDCSSCQAIMPAKCRLQNISCRQRAPLVLLMNNLFMPAWFHEFAALCYAHAVSSTENIGHPPPIVPRRIARRTGSPRRGRRGTTDGTQVSRACVPSLGCQVNSRASGRCEYRASHASMPRSRRYRCLSTWWHQSLSGSYWPAWPM